MSKNAQLLFLMLAAPLVLLSCVHPVLNKNYLREGDRKVSFSALRENPGQYKGKLFILGGVIVQTRLFETGSEIEAMHVPVDGYGYFEESGRSEGRFLAVLTGNGSILDPALYRRGRRVTLAGEFTGTWNGRIDDMEYTYPEFQIKQIYLWPMERYYYYAPPYYYDPWFYPYPYYYWGPWWSSHYYRYPVPVERRTNQRPAPSPPPPRREPRSER